MPRLTAEQRNRAVVMAQYIDCSPHEWPTERDIPVLCHALLDALNEIGTLRESAAVALGRKGGAAKVRKGLAMATPEQRKANTLKGWETRRANATTKPPQQ